MRLLRGSAVLATVVLLGGCGGGGTNGIEKLSADKALAKVKADVATVESVHVKGDISQGGGRIGLDVHIADGRGTGTLMIGGGTVELRLLEGTAYLRGDETALKTFGASDTEIAATADKWLKSSASGGAFQSFTTFLDLDSLFDSLLEPNGTIEAGSTTEVNGEKAFTLIDTGAEGGTLYVSETGKALPLRVSRSGAQGGHVDFLDYDEDVQVEEPAGAVDISQLG